MWSWIRDRKRQYIQNVIWNLSEIPFIDHLKVKAAITAAFSCVSGMTHSQSVKVRPQVVTAKCSEPQVESREAGMEEVE